jgi:hypothetical protein
MRFIIATTRSFSNNFVDLKTYNNHSHYINKAQSLGILNKLNIGILNYRIKLII